MLEESESMLGEVVKLRDMLKANQEHLKRFEDLLRIKDKEIGMLRETLRTFTSWYALANLAKIWISMRHSKQC